MVRADVIKLVSDTPAQHGAFDTVTQTQRTVMCEIKSVGMTETYTALSHGLNPQYKFVLALAEDYQGEKTVIYNSVKYRVIRTYVQGDGIEITVERADSDV